MNIEIFQNSFTANYSIYQQLALFIKALRLHKYAESFIILFVTTEDVIPSYFRFSYHLGVTLVAANTSNI
jgi:hypothetical protein